MVARVYTTGKGGYDVIFPQVIAGAGMDVDFSVVSPEGMYLVSEFRRSDGVHM